MDAPQLISLLERISISQRGAARKIGINERTMRKYISGDAPIPRTVALALERVRIGHEHEALLTEMHKTRDAVSAPFSRTTRKFRAIADGNSRENPTIEEIRTASNAMEQFDRARRRLKKFFEENGAAYLGEVG